MPNHIEAECMIHAFRFFSQEHEPNEVSPHIVVAESVKILDLLPADSRAVNFLYSLAAGTIVTVGQ
jgi:hypothetical protein